MSRMRGDSVESSSVVKKRRVINCIEQLSNEIFYEIFEYLDGRDIVHGFSNLNIRFEHLLNDPTLRFKMNLHFQALSQFHDHCKRYILSKQHRITSLRLIDLLYINPFLEFWDSFNRLESLSFVGIQSDEIISFLPKLTQLPSLVSLTIHLGNNCGISSEFYRLIFALPFLKYSKLSSNSSLHQIPSSDFISQELTRIEYLIIDHPCDLNQLIAMLYCTPRLRYLTCKRTIALADPIKTKCLRLLPNLTHIFFYEWRLNFHDLEIFIKNISAPLRVLCINTVEDSSYLDANRWERLISKYLSFLRTFNFEYSDFILIPHNEFVDKFTSDFWVNRQWILNIKIDMRHESVMKITYSIHSHKNKWFKFYNPSENKPSVNGNNDHHLPIPFYEGTELIVEKHGMVERNQIDITRIYSIFPLIQITCLHIGYFYPFSIDAMTDLICLLPNLDSLMISYVSSRQIGHLTNQQRTTVRLASNNNRIIRVKLGGVTNFEQLHTLFYLCPRIQHLEIGHTDDIDHRLLIRLILTKNIDQIPDLCSLYLWMPEINENSLKIFQKNTDLNKLLDEYRITCVSNGIYLQWDRHRLIAVKKLSYMQLRNQRQS